MRHLLRTTAIALATGGLAIGAQAQESSDATQTAAADQGFCETAWTKVDADSDGFVSKQEAQGAIDARFGQIDKDGDGNITRVEYVDCVTGTGAPTPAPGERTEANFQETDTNQDDAIDRDEFRDLAEQSYDSTRGASATDTGSDTSAKSDTSKSAEAQTDQSAGSQSEQTADAGETAASGPFVVMRRYVWLTPDEAGDPQMLRDMSKGEAAARSAYTFNSLDENNDDQVSVQEWKEREPSSGMTEDWANARFDEYDTDTSNAVSQEEYKQAWQRQLDQTTTASTESNMTGGEQTSDQDASDGQTSASSDQGIPVYFYHFHAF